MDFEEILTPVALYRSRLKREHAQNTAAAFETLAGQADIDIKANRALVVDIKWLEAELERLGKRVRLLRFFRGLCWAVAIISALVALLWVLQQIGFARDPAHLVPLHVGLIAALLAVGAFLLIFLVFNRRLRSLIARIDACGEEHKAKLDAAWKMMEPLNRLFRWDAMAKLVMKTLPILKIDRYASEERLRQLVEVFGWRTATTDHSSVIACQSGAINGNPWLIADELAQRWATKTYVGSRTISWVERDTYTDANGRRRSRLVTRYQTLYASVEKPIPVYEQRKRLVYGNEAAPKLNFSRLPNPLSGEEGGFFGRRKLKRAIDTLERRNRTMGDDDNFTLLDNRAFEACFNATDRDDEVAFRLLFTPLAQQEMLTLLRDKEVGFGDDFLFQKRGMINTLCSRHLNDLDISAAPTIFRGYDFAAVRERFLSYSAEFFHRLYFSFAPLFCIPLYQQHRNYQDIYTGIITEGPVSFVEHESLVNTLDAARFLPQGADTRAILKTKVTGRMGKDTYLTVTAIAYKGHQRVEHITKLGGDGRMHDIPVEWIEYLPVTRTTKLAVCDTGTDDHLALASIFEAPEWRQRMRDLKIGGTPLLFRRGLAVFPTTR